MDTHRNKTQKNTTADMGSMVVSENEDRFKKLLDAGTQLAFNRPWHRIERGLRLNRLRIFIEEISPQYDLSKENKEAIFLFLQKALDKKLLNTLKVVQYDPDTQRIVAIKGLEIKQDSNGQWKASFNAKSQKTDSTRKKKRAAEVSCTTVLQPVQHAASASETKIEEKEME